MRHRRQLVETVADLDEELGEEFLCADDPITVGPASLKAALRRVVANGKGLPVFAGSALKNTGVQVSWTFNTSPIVMVSGLGSPSLPSLFLPCSMF